MLTEQDVIVGGVRVIGLLDNVCFKSQAEEIKALEKLLAVEIPASALGVVIGSTYPSEDDRDKIWFRRDSGGNFVGLYAFQNGTWRPIYQFAPNQIIWMHGNSANIPTGFRLIQLGDPEITSSVVTALTAQYVPNGVGGYAYFATVFEGY